MSDLATRILDIIENSVRAGANVISVSFEEDRDEDRLSLTIEDNAPGVKISGEMIDDYFRSNRVGKRMKLGLSLLRNEARQAGGYMTVERSDLGGTKVKATMEIGHIDRCPVGDLAASLASVVCENPLLDIWLMFRVGQNEYRMRVEEIVAELKKSGFSGLTVARKVHEQVKQALESLQITA